MDGKLTVDETEKQFQRASNHNDGAGVYGAAGLKNNFKEHQITTIGKIIGL